MFLKLLGVAIGFLGIVAAFADLLGYFTDAEKVAFAELVMRSKDVVPRSTRGFEKFIRAFPPPDGIDPDTVTHIADKLLRIGSESNVGSTVAYVVNGKRTSSVARFDEVREWASNSSYRWISWIITAFGWFMVAVVTVSDILRARRAT